MQENVDLQRSSRCPFSENRIAQIEAGANIVSKRAEEKEVVDIKELLVSEVIQSEALINLLDRKGIISKQELLEEMKRVQATLVKSDV